MVVLWYGLLLMILFLMCGVSVLLVIIIMFMDFDYFIFILFEMYTIVFFMLVSIIGSSYERSGAMIFIIFFGFVLGFSVVINNALIFIGLLLLMLSLSKLPIYGLHIWLPNVHVEASIIGSMVLAGAVLKLSILYCWNFSSVIMVSMILMISVIVILTIIDSKSFAAYSSVLHITLCVIIGLIIILLIGYMHIILSPLIFITVYNGYSNSGSRFYIKLSLLIMILWIINFSLPFVSSFFSEVYILQYNSLIILVLVIMYMVVGYISMNAINIDGKSLFYVPFLVLYIIVI